MNTSGFKEGDILRFGWNHLFGEPSCIMSIQSTVLLKDGILQVPTPVRSGGKEITVFITLDDFIWLFDQYGPEVIQITRVEGSVQMPMFFPWEGVG